MKPITDIRRFGRHENAFGFLRLFLASLVIVSHTPEIADGNRSRELLTRLFGTMSFGELAVDGFFIVSGYLISGSFLKQPSPGRYLVKRIARIYPAFIVASLICLLVVVPLGGGGEGLAALSRGALNNLILLQPPEALGVFEGRPYPAVNGAMWTIAYEARCYVLVLLMGISGMFRHRRLVAAVTMGLLLAAIAIARGADPALAQYVALAPKLTGTLDAGLRLTGMFLSGATFYLWRDRIVPTTWGTIAATTACLACLCVSALASLGMAIFGAYLIFAIAAFGRTWAIGRINDRDDLSYGVYLYAWPIGKLILWYWAGMPLFAVGALTMVLALGCGWLSWHGVEKPVIKLAARLYPAS